jgi:UrcA family protein
MTKLMLAAAAALLISAPAFAEGIDQSAQSELPTQTVSVRGVDFASRDQVQHFYAKLRGAAQAVCDSGSASPVVTQADMSCVRDVMAQAVRAANKPTLTAMYDASSSSSTRAFAGNDQ